MPQYDTASTQRYVDSSSRKTEFDRSLDVLRTLAGESLARDIATMAAEHLRGEDEDDARRLETFLGALILGAAMELSDRGLAEAALRQLDQAKTVLEAQQKLTREVENIRSRVDEETFDVSALLGLLDEE